MRGADTFQEQLFTMKTLDDFVPADHPLRPIRERVNQALAKLDGLFSRMYADAEGLLSGEHFSVDGTFDSGVGEPQEFCPQPSGSI